MDDPDFAAYPPGVEWGVQAIYNLTPTFQFAAGVFNKFACLHTPSVPVQKFAKQVGQPDIVMPEKAGIQVRDFPGFRIALAIASLPGMTDEFSQLLGRHTGATKRGSYSVDRMFQQMVYRDGGARSQKSLTLWAEVAVAPKPSVNIMPYFVDGGVSYQGAVPGRDIDIASAGLIYGTFSRYIPRTTAETAIKANYQVNSKRRLSITPDFQYIIGPSGSGAIGNAVVLGTQLAISF